MPSRMTRTDLSKKLVEYNLPFLPLGPLVQGISATFTQLDDRLDAGNDEPTVLGPLRSVVRFDYHKEVPPHAS